MGKCKSLCFEERALIEKFLKMGLTCSEIGRRLGRGKNTIVVEVRNKGREGYTATKAQKQSDETRSLGYKKLSEINSGKKKTYFYKERIENLEMQVEILHETIKELMKK